MMRKTHLIILSLFVVISSIALIKFKQPGTNTIKNAHLPWNIDIIQQHTRVFGLTLGKSTFSDAMALLGNDIEMAILTKPGTAPALEIFTSHYRSGFLTGSLILVADINDDDMKKLQEKLTPQQEYLESGSTKTMLRHEQKQLAASFPIKSITFIPVAAMNESLVELRFGKPGQVLASASNVKHYLFPQFGLDIIIDEKGKDYLHYVSPDIFSSVQAVAEAQAQTYQEKTE